MGLWEDVVIFEAMSTRGVAPPTVNQMEIFEIAVLFGAHTRDPDEGVTEEQWEQQRDMTARVEQAAAARAAREEVLRRSKGR